jgi:hypothetical protein
MQRVDEDPPAVEELHRVGGVLDFSFFRDAINDRGHLTAAILEHMRTLKNLGPVYRPTINPGAAAELPVRQIDRQTFLGEYYDAATGSLRFGDVEVLDRSDVTESCGGASVQIDSGEGRDPHEPSTDGHLAYAFFQTPHSLTARPKNLNRLFREIVHLVAPEGEVCEILDWSGPQLASFSDYFTAGLEWWGVFLFTVFQVDSAKLVVITGSTTD